MYRNRENGAILSQGEVRKLYANTSLPAVWDQTVCNDLGIDPILSSPQPTPSLLETIRQDGVIQDSLGNWVEHWILAPMFTEYTTQDGTVVTQGEQEQAYLAQKNEAQWNSIRTTRNQKLSSCDWTQLPDAPVDQAAWAVYRQELRDMTNQTDPFNITWAQEPTEETP